MKIKTEITLTYSKENLEELIAEQAKRDGYEIVSIKFLEETKSVGYGMDERDVTVFTGVEVKVKPNTKVDPRNTGQII